eukprot:s47_g30.t2
MELRPRSPKPPAAPTLRPLRRWHTGRVDASVDVAGHRLFAAAAATFAGGRSHQRRRCTDRRAQLQAQRKAIELDGQAVSPQNDNPHRHTLIYLHGLGGSGSDYLNCDESDLLWPWRLGTSYAAGLRAVFPTAPLVQQPWGETIGSWYQYLDITSNQVSDQNGLERLRDALDEVIEQEVRRLEAGRVFLGGISQGCNFALDAYLRSPHNLGGFVGSVGFVPGDAWGFRGADEHLRKLQSRRKKAAQPVWLQAAEEDSEVPFELVESSLERIDHWPGFRLEKLQGLGHDIGQHEATLLGNFLKVHAEDAYFEVDLPDDDLDELEDLKDHDILAPTWSVSGDESIHGGPIVDVGSSLRLSTGEAVSPLVCLVKMVLECLGVSTDVGVVRLPGIVGGGSPQHLHLLLLEATLWELPTAKGSRLLGNVWTLCGDRRSAEPFRELCLYDNGDIDSFCEMTSGLRHQLGRKDQTGSRLQANHRGRVPRDKRTAQRDKRKRKSAEGIEGGQLVTAY